MAEYLDFAVATAQEAGALLMEHFGKIQKLEWKLRTNFKTQVDDASDDLIRRRIEARFPGHRIYSEELAAKETGSKFVWVVDTLDGTLPYTIGENHFSVCIGLVHGVTLILGVIFAPMRNELYVAEREGGAFLNGEPIRVADVSNLNHALLPAETGKVPNRERKTELEQQLLAEHGATFVFTYGCASVPLASVARGRLHGFLAHKLEPWDMAAAVPIIQEAGGRVTALDGTEWRLG